MTIKTETIAETGLNLNNESPSYITEMITTLESETNKLKIFWAIETMAVIQGGISSTILNMIQSLATEMSAMDAELSMLKDQNNLTILTPNPDTLTAIKDRIKIIEDKQTELFKKLNLNALEA